MTRIAILGNLVSYGLHYLRAMRGAGGDVRLYHSRYGAPPGEAGDPSIESLREEERARVVMWNILPYGWSNTRSRPLKALRNAGTALSRFELLVALRRSDVIHALGGENSFARLARRPYFAHATGSDLRETILNHVRGIERSRAAAGLLEAYGDAEAVLVAVPEMMPMAREAGLENARYAPMPLDLDLYKGEGSWRPATDGIRIFAAARLEWDYDGHVRRASSLKANDRIVRAFARFVARQPPARLSLRSIGSDLPQTRQLVSDLGIDGQVEYVGPLSRAQLIERYLNADVVVDQFVGGCLGLVGLEAMALARPLITRIDPELYEGIGSSIPPAMSAGTIEEIESALDRLLDETIREGLGRKSRAWIAANHDAKMIGAHMLKMSERAVSSRRVGRT